MNDYLKYLGCYTLFIPVFSILFLALLLIILYSKIKGSSSILATVSFYIPMVGSLFLGILLFYTDHFWITLLFYTIVFFMLNVFSFKALETSLKDKTGLGVTMFSGLISMYAFFFCAILCFILQLF